MLNVELTCMAALYSRGLPRRYTPRNDDED